MKRYQSYKPSSVEWVGYIPNSWEETRLKYIGNLYGGLTGKSGEDFKQDDNPNNKPYIPYTNIFRNTYISKNHVDYVVLEDSENQNKVQKFDLFFLMSSETYQDLGKPCILIDDIEELYLNSFCKGFRVNRIDVNPLFLNYQLLGSIHKELISIEGRGFTRINLRQDRLNETPIFLPPLQEQHQIVQFLDEKTELIDRLISTKERKINLLKEQRTSLINQVVTKGLNPNVKMKDSGVEWIGEIPVHWGLRKLTHISDYVNCGYTSTPEYVDEGVMFLSGQNVKNGKIDYTKFNYISEELHNELTKRIKPQIGDLLVVRVGGHSNIGMSCVVDTSIDFSIYVSLTLLRLKYTICSSYFFNFIFNNDRFREFCLVETKIGGGVGNLNVKDFERFQFPLPPLQEQHQIVEYLNSKTKKIDDLVQLEQKKIDLLKEYRQSLISEVVTGKIKVTTDE